jgi:hexosaminidase
MSLESALDSLVPMPVRVTPGAGICVLSGFSRSSLTPRLRAAVERVLQRLEKRFGAPLSADGASDLVIETHDLGSTLPSPDMDESYTLTVAGDGVHLRSAGEIGALRGLQTLQQLITCEDGAWQVPWCEIEDRPRFSWRGMLLDTSRHFMHMEHVLRLLDCMEVAKLNVLHFHLANDQGFRMECDTFPKLHEEGSEGAYYTKNQMREIIAYAADRGIRVVPEFCLPGHSVSWQVAYPELSASDEPPSQIGETRGAFSIPIDPSKEETYRFIEAFVAEMADLFPDPYFHTGGDEVNPTAWKENPRIKGFMDENSFRGGRDLQAYFTGRYAQLVAAQGKIPIGWEEVLHSDVSRDVIVHLWKDGAYGPDLARHPVLTSWNTYLDLQQPAEWLYAKDPLDFHIDGKPPSESLNVVGAEMTNWAETIHGGNLDMRTWPRGAAIAERFWSPRGYCDEMGQETLYDRLAAFEDCLTAAGSRHAGHAQRACAELYDDVDADAVARFADLIEPAAYPFLRRRRLLLERALPRLFPSPDVERYSDMKRFVDHLPGESLVGRQFRLDVEELAATGDHDLARHVAERLMVWEALADDVRTLVRRSPAMRADGLGRVALGVGRIARIGSYAMQTLQKGQTLSPIRAWWYKKRLRAYAFEVFYLDKDVVKRVIRDLRKPDMLNRHNIAIQPGVAHLLEMACGEGR